MDKINSSALYEAGQLFEEFRFNDLRRWKCYNILNTEGTRQGLSPC